MACDDLERAVSPVAVRVQFGARGFASELRVEVSNDKADWRRAGAARAVDAAMQIFIKTLTGRKTNFNFETDNTVRHVK